MKKNDYFKLTIAQQRTILEQTATKRGLPKQAIEKDLWVTALLQIIFNMPFSTYPPRNSFHFPGGHTPTAQETKEWYVPLVQKLMMEIL